MGRTILLLAAILPMINILAVAMALMVQRRGRGWPSLLGLQLFGSAIFAVKERGESDGDLRLVHVMLIDGEREGEKTWLPRFLLRPNR